MDMIAFNLLVELTKTKDLEEKDRLIAKAIAELEELFKSLQKEK